MNGYNQKVVCAWFAEQGIPQPEFEYQFCERKWKFDIAWEFVNKGALFRRLVPFALAIEVQGGIWVHGRHNRGAALKKEWEKLNTAASMGWRILYCEPRDLCTTDFAETIKLALNI